MVGLGRIDHVERPHPFRLMMMFFMLYLYSRTPTVDMMPQVASNTTDEGEASNADKHLDQAKCLSYRGKPKECKPSKSTALLAAA